MAVIIVKGRQTFTNQLFDAKQYNGEGPFKYANTIIVDPASADAKLVNETILAVATEAWNKEAAATIRSFGGNNQKICWTSGDTNKNELYHGFMLLSAKRAEKDGRVKIVDRNPNIELTKTDGKPYSGCYVKMKVDIWAQKKAGQQGIRATLVGVQFVGDGDAFGPNAPASAEGFEDESEGSDDSAGLI